MLAVTDKFSDGCLPLDVLVSFEGLLESESSEGRFFVTSRNRELASTRLCADQEDVVGEGGGSSSSVGDPRSGAVASTCSPLSLREPGVS